MGEQVCTSSLFAGVTGKSTTERLLSSNSTGAIAVDLEVTSSVAQSRISNLDSLAVLSEDKNSQSIYARTIDLLTNFDEISLSSTIVTVDDNDRAELLAREKRVIRIRSAVNSGLNLLALGRVVRATNEKL